ncbi:hypothetical protein H4219_006467 [Mycoemilia scoparia]|uniref:CCHC-type domain-containing protein n=1 Tax=Mycoemilia scoparia TaxID=417184 RepID=A0A9W7ZN27_9FUNG|nr:hypothetical protein H4219_006467 [Mycoemilia scoparia]
MTKIDEKKAKRQISQLQTLYQSVTAWSIDEKIEKLLTFVFPEWLPELLPEIRGITDLDTVFEKVIEFAKKEAKKPKWEKSIRDSMQKTSRTISDSNKNAENSKPNKIEELTKRVARLTLLIEQNKRPPQQHSTNCFYCGKNGHNMRGCLVLDDDLEKGNVEKRNGKLYLPNNGPPLVPSEDGLRNSLAITSNREVNLIEMAEVIYEDEEETNNVDIAEKRKVGDIERDSRGIPIVK